MDEKSVASLCEGVVFLSREGAKWRPPGHQTKHPSRKTSNLNSYEL